MWLCFHSIPRWLMGGLSSLLSLFLNCRNYQVLQILFPKYYIYIHFFFSMVLPLMPFMTPSFSPPVFTIKPPPQDSLKINTNSYHPKKNKSSNGIPPTCLALLWFSFLLHITFQSYCTDSSPKWSCLFMPLLQNHLSRKSVAGKLFAIKHHSL